MPYLELEIPPGLYRNGTQFQSRGRWYDGSLVRWHGGATQPVGGWKAIAMTGEEVFNPPSDTMGYVDFADAEVGGGAPEGWNIGRFGFSGVPVMDVVADAEAPSGKALVMTSNNFAFFHVWKDDIAPFANGEVLVLARMPRVSSGWRAGPLFRWTPESPGGLNAGFGDNNRVLELTYYNGSSFSPTDVRIGNFATPAENSWWWVRVNFNGPDYKLKIWAKGNPEPEEWGDEGTNGDAPLTPGIPGFGGGITSTRDWRLAVFSWSNDPNVPAPGAEDEVESGGGSYLEEPILGALAWRDNDNVPWLAMGTPTTCWIYSEGLARTIMPGDFVAGTADGSTEIAGYGTGAYGAGLYGEGVVNSVGTVLEAQNWQFDTFGELLVAHAHSDPDIWVWNPQGDEAQRLQNHEGTPGDQVPLVPRHNQGIVVTPERFLVALGADGDPRNIRWADQETLGIWSPTPENQAGDFVLPGSGIIMCGSRARQETLIWTTQDLFTMQYIGGTLVYSFAQVGTNCGIISRRGYAMVDGARALWMGTDSFFAYEGGVMPLVCEVGDDVFNDINTTQASKIFAVVFSEFSEVWWFYPSKDSDEVDKYVAYNYAEAHWSMGDLSRTAGVPRGVFPYPILMDRLGQLYDHERGGEYFDLDGETPLLPFIESGPIDIAQGDQTMWVRYIVPDENTLGDTRAYLKSRLYPTATENTFGPFSMAEPTSTRMSGRQVSLRIEQVQPGWRLGVPRLEVVPAGRR